MKAIVAAAALGLVSSLGAPTVMADQPPALLGAISPEHVQPLDAEGVRGKSYGSRTAAAFSCIQASAINRCVGGPWQSSDGSWRVLRVIRGGSFGRNLYYTRSY